MFIVYKNMKMYYSERKVIIYFIYDKIRHLNKFRENTYQTTTGNGKLLNYNTCVSDFFCRFIFVFHENYLDVMFN